MSRDRLLVWDWRWTRPLGLASVRLPLVTSQVTHVRHNKQHEDIAFAEDFQDRAMAMGIEVVADQKQTILVPQNIPQI